MAGTFAELDEQFFRANYAPSTGIESFRCRMFARPRNHHDQDLSVPEHHGRDRRKSFATQFAQIIPQTWNDRFIFKCTKAGFDMNIKPKFRLR
jgi:hypothetical protein